MVFGVVVGTGYGLLKFGSKASAAGDNAVQVVPTAEPAVASAPQPPAALPLVDAAAQRETEGPKTSADSAPRSPPGPAMALKSPSPAVAAAAPSPVPRSGTPNKTRDPLMPSDEEIKRRMQMLDSDPKPQPSAARPAPPSAQPRSGNISIF